jgi:hypothetical protein
MTEDNSLLVAGWEPFAITPELFHRFGYPGGTTGYRKLVHDGALVAIVGQSTNGWAFALSHVVTLEDPDAMVPGRYPTFAEVYGARRVLVPDDALMVAVLEPMSFALRLRWQRAQSTDPLAGLAWGGPPAAPGLPTTVKCVQMYCEGVTEDCVFGTEDIPSPTPVPPRGSEVYPARDPVGPVPFPDELLGDAEAALKDDDEEPDATK